jgi:hypothetical protein
MIGASGKVLGGWGGRWGKDWPGVEGSTDGSLM